MANNNNKNNNSSFINYNNTRAYVDPSIYRTAKDRLYPDYSKNAKLSAAEQKNIAKVAIETQKNIYKEMSILEKQRAKQKELNAEKEYLKELNYIKELDLARTKSEAKRLKILKKYNEELDASNKRQEEASKENARLEKIAADVKLKTEEAFIEKQSALQQKIFKAKKNQEEKEAAAKKSKDAYQTAQEKALQTGSAEDITAANVAKQKMLSDAKIAERAKLDADNITNMLTALKTITATLTKDLDTVMSTMSQYAGRINARLQGTDNTYDTMYSKLLTNLAASPYVKIQDVLSKITELSDKGIAYNIEMRAFLGTISEDIANTFDAANGTLLRLIRLQQADSTIARLGIEASLTKFLNSKFEDTSYLTDVADNISSTILEANSQLARDESAAFEYTVQKWLGSLYSVGASSEFVSMLAQGLNYLSTGNVNALAQNQALQTLFAMGSSKSGVPYSDILVNGLSVSNTNKLLQSIVEYLQDISKSQNQVVKSAYGNIFNFSLSDLRAISNLTSQDITSISSQSLSYSQATTETMNQLMSVSGRLPLQALVNNIWDNLQWTLASDMVSIAPLYYMYKLGGAIPDGMTIPGVTAAGFGLNNLGEIGSWMQVLSVAPAAMMTLVQALMSIGNSGGLNLNSWNYAEYTSRGKGFSGSSNLVTSTSGQSTSYIGNASSADMSSNITQQAKDSSGASEDIKSGEHANDRTLEDLFVSLVDPYSGAFIATGDILLSRAFVSNGQEALSVFDPNLTLVTVDSEQGKAILVSPVLSETSPAMIKCDEISRNTAATVIMLEGIATLLTSMMGTTGDALGVGTSYRTALKDTVKSNYLYDEEKSTSADMSKLADAITAGFRSILPELRTSMNSSTNYIG